MDIIESYIDEIVIIPEEIKRMTKEERQLEIAKLEAKAFAEKQRILKNKQNQG